MRSCEEYREMFNAYLDCEMNRLERMEIEAHLETCGECAKIFNQYKKLYGAQPEIMPESVSRKVMERVNASVSEDLFSGESKENEIEMQMRKKIRKKEGIKAWMFVAVVAVLAVAYYMLEDYVLGKNTPKDMAEQEMVEHVSEENLSDVMSALRSSMVNADSVTVKFGTARVELYEKFKLEYLADYITSCEYEEIEGRIEYKSIGSIRPDPDANMNIQISDEHKIIFSANSKLYIINTERDDLLYALRGVGILA